MSGSWTSSAGRSQRTIGWYEQKINTYLRASGIAWLEQLTAFEFKRYLAELQGRGLAPNTVHGYFETLKAPAAATRAMTTLT